jgi:predicted porin
MSRFYRILAVTILSGLALDGVGQQKNITVSEQTWLAYFNQTRFTNRSGIWFDGHLRFTDDFAERMSQDILRLAYVYYLHDNVRLAAGYAYITNYSGDDNIPNLNEHRPWQQIQWFEKKRYFNMMQYLRLEERFKEYLNQGEVAEDYQFNYRIRYNMAFTIPLKAGGVQPKSPFVFVNNEVMLNMGKAIVNNYFDQNRFFVGMGYQFTKGLNAQLGYLNVFLERPSGSDFINAHAIRLFVFHNLDLRKTDN